MVVNRGRGADGGVLAAISAGSAGQFVTELKSLIMMIAMTITQHTKLDSMFVLSRKLEGPLNYCPHDWKFLGLWLVCCIFC